MVKERKKPSSNRFKKGKKKGPSFWKKGVFIWGGGYFFVTGILSLQTVWFHYQFQKRLKNKDVSEKILNYYEKKEFSKIRWKISELGRESGYRPHEREVVFFLNQGLESPSLVVGIVQPVLFLRPFLSFDFFSSYLIHTDV